MIKETTLVEGKYCYSGFVSRILWLVGFIPKVLVRSGCKDPRAMDKLGGRVFRHIWRPELDYILFKLEVNIHVGTQLDQGDPTHLGHRDLHKEEGAVHHHFLLLPHGTWGSSPCTW
jgi:hypothetical protein